MINKLSNIDNTSTNAFSVFNKGNASDNYGITKPYTKKMKDKKDESDSKYLGVKIATTALVAGFGVFLLMKGLPKSFYKKMNDYFNRLADKINAEEKNKQNVTKLKIGYLKTLKVMKSITGGLKALFNEGVLKDTLLIHGINKVKVLKNINNWITKKFEKIAIKKSRKFYEKSFHHLESIFSDYKDTNKMLLSKNPAKKVSIKREIGGKTVTDEKTVEEWVEELEKRMGKVRENFFSNFLLNSRKDRLTETKEALSTLHDEVWEMTFKHPRSMFKNKTVYQSFISEEIAKPYKFDLINKVNISRKTITNDINDTYFATKELVSNIKSAPEDSETRKTLNMIKETLMKYKRANGTTEIADRNATVKVLNKQLATLSKNIKDFGYKPELEAETQKYIHELNNVIKQNKKGEIQEILTIYRQLCPEKYPKIKNNTYDFVDSLNKAMKIETDKLFDKLRDMSIGSVPADVLSILTSFGIVSYGLAKADNNDERVSVALKYGIPVVGAVLTSVLCTVGLVSGGPAIILGLLSGEIIHKIGSFTDEQIKNYKNKKNNISIQNLNNYIENKTAETMKIIQEPMKPQND